MKKFVALMLTIVTLLSAASAFGEMLMPENGSKTKKNGNMTIDYSHMNDGYVMVKATKGTKKLKLQVKMKGATLTYDLNNKGEYEVFPLQFGNGKYTFMLLSHFSGKKWEDIGSVSLTAKMPDENKAFLYPNQYVNYTPKTAAVEEAAKICEGLIDDAEKWTAIKSYVKDHFAYDFVKASQIGDGVLPDLDGTWQSQMGICQDLSAITVAMLRSQGVPARLLIGSFKGQYHAWVSLTLEGKERWWDPTVSIQGQKAQVSDYKVERYY